MNVPRKMPVEASSTHGEPCSISRIPQLIKKANSTNTAVAKANFMRLIINPFAGLRKCVRCLKLPCPADCLCQFPSAVAFLRP